jgi:hypothetical protein
MMNLAAVALGPVGFGLVLGLVFVPARKWRAATADRERGAGVQGFPKVGAVVVSELRRTQGARRKLVPDQPVVLSLDRLLTLPILIGGAIGTSTCAKAEGLDCGQRPHRCPRSKAGAVPPIFCACSILEWS